jgi:hypothetical protein
MDQASAEAAPNFANQFAKGGDVIQGMTLLPEDFTPTIEDVICGRGRRCFSHCGNDRFRTHVDGFLVQYSQASSKLEKSFILSDIVAKVQANRPGGGFVKKCPETKRWYEVGCFLAREKTSQTFRDALSDQYKSSNSAKKKRRQVAQAIKFQKTCSSSDLVYDAAAEPLDASNQKGSKVFKTRATSFDDSILLLDDPSNIARKSIRPRMATSNLIQGMVGASARSVFDFRTAEHISTNLSPRVCADPKSYQSQGSTHNTFWGTNTGASTQQYGSSSRMTAENLFIKSMNTKPFVEPSKPNHFYSNDSSLPYPASLLSVGESMNELVILDCFEEKDVDGIVNDDGHGWLNNLSSLVEVIPNGDPFEPIPLPENM